MKGWNGAEKCANCVQQAAAFRRRLRMRFYHPPPTEIRHPMRIARLLSLLVVTALASSALVGCATPARTPIAATQSVATFDAAWEIVRDEHFDSELNGVDWNAVRAELRPQAAKARSVDELRAVLSEMLARLGQSHFTIIPGEGRAEIVADRAPTTALASSAAEAPRSEDDSGLDGAVAAASGSAPGAVPAAETPVEAGPGVSGIDIAIVEGAPMVLRVSPDLPGARSGVLVGWRLVSVNGMSADAVIEPIRHALSAERNPESPSARELRARLATAGAALLSGNAGDRLEMVFADASGAERQVSLALAEAPFGSTKFGNLPPLPVEVDARIVEIPVAGGKPVRIGVLAFNIWMTGASDAIDRAVDSMRSCDGIILDLRGNPGGMGAMSMGVAGHFLREPTSLGSMIGRDNTLEFKSIPRKVSADGKRVRPYATKPLAILVDARSASTSEVFAAGLQELGRARVFGETSAGMALPAQARQLPNGDVLLHAVADFVTPNGTRIEGRGVVPDEAVAASRAELARGEDSALAAATRWIERSTNDTRAAKSLQPASAMPVAMPAPHP